MVVLSLVTVFVCTWVGAALLIDAYCRRRRRPSLAERLAPYHPRCDDVAVEVEQWLRSH